MEISREAGEKEQLKRKKSMETDFKEIAKRLDTMPSYCGVATGAGRFPRNEPRRLRN